MRNQRVRRREWTWATGPRRYRVRVYQDPAECGGNIVLEIRDARRPGYRYRSLSLGHADRERAMRHAEVLSRWWRQSGRPPRLVWRRGRGVLPRDVAVR
jgi:hypothetical protein